MIHFFRNLRFDTISFWGGFLAALLLWWALRVTSPVLRKGWEYIKKGFKPSHQDLFINTEKSHRADTLNYVQGLHLSAPLFSLDEILIPPRFMAPPIQLDPDIAPPHEDVLSTIIPYTPDWPEMAAAYNANTIEVFEVLAVTRNIALIYLGCQFLLITWTPVALKVA